MIPLSQALLMRAIPSRRAGTALAIWAITTLVAPVAGPLLGGWITDNISWPWIFYINVPVGIVAAFVTWLIYRKRETPTRKLPIDGVGLGLLVRLGGRAADHARQGQGPRLVPLDADRGAGVVAVVGFAVFLVWELTEEHPIVDLSPLQAPQFLGRHAGARCAPTALFFGNVVLLPLWLQQYMGYTATLAGLVLAPVGLLAIVLTPFVGRFSDRFDPRILVTISFAVFALVLFMRAQFNTDATIGTLLVPTIIQGAGMAAFFIPLMSLTLAGLPPERIPAASGLSNFARITAGSFGTSITTTLWDRRATLHHAQLVEHLDR